MDLYENSLYRQDEKVERMQNERLEGKRCRQLDWWDEDGIDVHGGEEFEVNILFDCGRMIPLGRKATLEFVRAHSSSKTCGLG